MTTLTRIDIDDDRRHARWATASRERVHGIIALACDGAADGEGRPLWRLEDARDGRRLYLLTPGRPDEGVLKQLGVAESRDYTPILHAIRPGSEWMFRLEAAPSRDNRGRRYSLFDDESRLAWLEERVRRAGAHLPVNRLGVPEAIIRGDGYEEFSHREEGRITFASCVFDGVLAVDDPKRFRRALVDGIGRGRAYGMGLLTIRPVKAMR